MLDKLQNLIDDGTITIGAEDGLYDPRTIILLGQECLAVVEGFRVDADPISLAKREYHVIVDFSIITDTEYLNGLSHSVLSDGRENYFPIITNTEESERFNRFDLVFSVPVTSRIFELTFNTCLDTVGKIRFKVDINSLADKIETGTPGGCMFFGIEQIPSIFVYDDQTRLTS